MKPPTVLALCFLTWNAAGQGVPRPEDGIYDEARALTEETHAVLATEIAKVRAEFGCEVWLSAETRGGAAGYLRARARDLRQAWSGERESVLFAFDRAGNQTALSFSPSIWQKHSPAELAAAAMETGVLMADKSVPLDARLTAAMRALLQRYAAVETGHRRVGKPFLLLERRLAAYVAPLLAVGGVALFLFGSLRRDPLGEVVDQVEFPEVEVGKRYGAACGGGTVVARQGGMAVES